MVLGHPDQNLYKWFFLDLNSYFASVEQQENPNLRGRPVAVVPMMTDATCAIAASYEAKAYGVKTGTKIYEAKKMCPDLVCVLARHDIYVRYHHRILDEIIKHVPINKVWSIDELSSRLPPNKRDSETVIALAKKVKKGLHENVGEAINCSIGIAPNSFLAKIASNMQKPDGLTILTPDTMTQRLFRLKLTDLPGINVNMQERLRKCGITTVEALWHISPKHARRAWGSVEGERFWYNLHGYEVPERETSRSMIGHSRMLDPEHRMPSVARLVARRLTTKAAARLRRQDFYATSFHLGVRLSTGEKWGAGVQLSPSQDNFAFLKALEELWQQMYKSLPHQGGGNRPLLKKVSVTMHGLCKRAEITPDLFDTTSASFQELQIQDKALSKVVDTLNERYGAETVQIGVSPKTRAGHVGTKVAFSRIPDLAEFHE